MERAARMQDPGMGRALATFLVAMAVVACQGAAPGTASTADPTPNPAPVASAGPQWTQLEAGEPLYDAPFDAAFDEAFSGVAYGAGFVLVGRTRDDDGSWRGGIWSTPDGAQWKRVAGDGPQVEDAYLWNLGTDGHRLVALGWAVPWPERRGPYIAWVSDDGVTWARHDVEGSELGRIYVDGIVGAASGFVAWGEQADGHTLLLHSSDGLAWTAIDYAGAETGQIRSIAPLGAGFVAVGEQYTDTFIAHGPNQPARAWWSADGREWAAVDVPGGFALRGVYPAASGVFAVGGHECSACVGPRETWGSPDGRSWQSLGDEHGIYPFVASNGSQVATFDWQGDRTVALSADGLLWTKLARVPAAEHDAGMIVGSTGVLILLAKTPLDENNVQVVHQGVLFLKGT